VARRILEKYEYQVLLAVDGVDAVAQYALHHEKVAVVITDMTMPVMGGPATILALRGINPHVKVIASSGHDAETARKEAGAAGANISDFILKPYTAEQLLQTVRRVLREGSRSPFKTPAAPA
jgi:CheY-like chemotaxis protein